VITVPAYFSDGQRQATKDAGTIAGLEVLRIVNEPTAAALAFGFKKRMNKKIAVYDLGGGTFDISILEITQDAFEVLATAGNTYLGGEDFDDRVIQHIAGIFQKEQGFDLKSEKMALQRLKDASEAAKCQLSTLLETEINLPFVATMNGESKHLRTVLHRLDLERLTEDLIEETIKICNDAIEMAGLKTSDIDDVILVGGMTRMPKVQEKVKEFFGKVPAKNVHPDEAVAIGAAILGSTLMAETSQPLLLLDVTPFNLGIRTAGGLFSTLIPKNSTIPTQASHIFTTVSDNQRAVKIQVLQGDSHLASENVLLGEFSLTDIPPAKAGEPEIEVSFTIDSNGIVQASARDLKTQREQSIVVEATSAMSDREKEELVQKYQANREGLAAKESSGL